MASYLIGVDVGTGSARAGVFDVAGRLLATAKRPITMHREDGGIAEQSSGEVWKAVCDSVRESVSRAGDRSRSRGWHRFRCHLLARGARA